MVNKLLQLAAAIVWNVLCLSDWHICLPNMLQALGRSDKGKWPASFHESSVLADHTTMPQPTIRPCANNDIYAGNARSQTDMVVLNSLTVHVQRTRGKNLRQKRGQLAR